RDLAACELLLQHILQLLCCERYGHEAIAKGLYREGFPVGDVARWLPAAALIEDETVHADPTRVHQGDLCTAECCRLGGLQLCVGDQIAGRHFAGGVLDVGHVLSNRPDQLVRHRRHERVVLGHDVCDDRIRRDRQVGAGDDYIVHCHAHDLTAE